MAKVFLSVVLCLVIVGFLLPLGSVQAISLMDGISGDCQNSGTCSVCDIMVVAYNVGRLIFMSMAGVAMILLIIAAIGLMFNFGNPEAIARSKKLIIHTLIAILIIMAAFTIVGVVSYVLSSGETSGVFQWQGRSWYEGPKC